jgi:RNA polymerase sigma factor (sigma-70 family)
MPDLTDIELLENFRDPGKRSYAFNLIMCKYQQKIYWHVRRMVIDHDDANDLVQNTFIKAWKGLENFREDSNLYTWLYRIATNECLSFLRQKRLRTFISFGDIEQELSDNLIEDSYFRGDDLQLKLQKAILKLPDKQRIIFNMKYYDEMKYEEIAQILGTSVGALKASYHHAVKKIEKLLTGD